MNNVLNKDDFCRIIKNMLEVHNFQSKVNNFIKTNAEGYVFWPDGTIELLEVLSKMFCDNDGWIGYFFCDMESGAKYKPGKVKDHNGNEIAMRDAGDLYDLLISNMENQVG